VSECVYVSGISTGLGRVLRGLIIVTCMAVEIVSRLQQAGHRNTLIKKTFVILAPFPYLQTSNESQPVRQLKLTRLDPSGREQT